MTKARPHERTPNMRTSGIRHSSVNFANTTVFEGVLVALGALALRLQLLDVEVVRPVAEAVRRGQQLVRIPWRKGGGSLA